MSTDEKIRIGLAVVSVVSAAVLAAHFGHVSIQSHFLDALGPGGGSE